MVSLAIFTRPDFEWSEPKANDHSSPPLRTLAPAATGLIFVQLLLGAAFRHHGFGIVPHIVGAGLVTVAVLWTLVRVLSAFGTQPRLTRAAWLVAGLLAAQIGIGIGSYWEALDESRRAAAAAGRGRYHHLTRGIGSSGACGEFGTVDSSLPFYRGAGCGGQATDKLGA